MTGGGARAVVRWPQQGGWLGFEEPLEILQAEAAAGVPALLDRIDRQARHGRWAVGYVAYEAAAAFDPALTTLAPAPGVPLAWFAVFEAPRPLPRLPDAAPFVPPGWQPELDRQGYLARVERIRNWIARGDTYQTNLTYRLRGSLTGDPWALFAALCTTQPVDYACFLETETWALASASPELFFELEDREIVCRPMKGTRPRGRTLAEDDERMRELRESTKDRAENLMIVDMVRNDLGRIASPGSIVVDSLFDLERYATVWQMTSRIRAVTGAGLREIFTALFPSASVTGAPKIRTMRIISDLEVSPRGVYTGAIGIITPQRRFRFNVAIRTAWIDRRSGRGEYGVGGGVVWDSSAEEEHAECAAKAVALTRPRPRFSLLETLLWVPGRGYTLLDRHLDRLAESAAYFGFPLDLDATRALLADRAPRSATGRLRARLLLSAAGELSVECHDLVPVPEPWNVELAVEAIDPEDPFLFHKTTHRETYERLRRAAPEADDVVLWNPRGELTESTRANLAVRRDGGWLTPPVECGLLAGTCRADLLASGELREERIGISELESAEEIRLLNSLRGWIRVTIRPRR